ncbi:hypothetical protein GCM10027280_41800 [Micromonospora polyrhachis]|uniref:Uncharacterized protein n=1 Tax=Micromonospora polyrhachis TaxID=1282883 RepID=A0A7W7WND7_9ACTN|nr:SUKH-3 domain-containing protein [Micromonospora polyrhachis]MBB4957123.1 hypothetical protein [Micromonospora polyrhachis]
MITPEQAEAIADKWAHALHPDSTVQLERFDLGFVARRTLPELAGVTGIVMDAPATMIIDGTTGVTTPCPNVDTASLVRLYTAQAAARDRFSAPLLGLLRMAGWQPGREMGGIADAWWARCAPAGAPFPASVRAVVSEFGGINLRPARLWLAPTPVDVPVTFVPVDGGVAAGVGAIGDRIIAVDEHGGIHLSQDGTVERVGDTFDAGLARMLNLAER